MNRIVSRRSPGTSRRSLFLGLLASAIAMEGTLHAAANWVGSIRCEIRVEGPGYSDQQTHVWTLTGEAPTQSGAFQNYPATWSVTGQGWFERPAGDATAKAQWTSTVSGQSAPISFFVRASDGKLIVKSAHAQLRVNGAVVGEQRTITPDGQVVSSSPLRMTVFETSVLVIEGTVGTTQISGSSTTDITGSVGPMQPAGCRVTAKYTWTLGQGSAAALPPPSMAANPPPPGTSTTGAPVPPPTNSTGSSPPSSTTGSGNTTPPPSTTTSTPPPSSTSTPPAGTTSSGSASPTPTPTGTADTPTSTPPNTGTNSSSPTATPTATPASEPLIVIDAPNNHQTWAVGVTRDIVFYSTLPESQFYDVDFSPDGAGTWQILVHGTTAMQATGPKKYFIGVHLPLTPTTLGLIRVSTSGNPAVSDITHDRFSLVIPTIAVSQPSAGSVVNIGARTRIDWTFSPSGGPYWFKLAISHDGGSTWTDQGLFRQGDWVFNGPATTHARVRIQLYDPRSETLTGAYGDSGEFTIVDPSNTAGGQGSLAGVTATPILTPVVLDSTITSVRRSPEIPGQSICYAPRGTQGFAMTFAAPSAHFVQGTTTTHLGDGIHVLNTQVLSATSAKVTFNVESTTSVGARNLVVTTGTEVKSGASAFYVTPSPDGYSSDMSYPTNLGTISTGVNRFRSGHMDNPYRIRWFQAQVAANSPPVKLILDSVGGASEFIVTLYRERPGEPGNFDSLGTGRAVGTPSSTGSVSVSPSVWPIQSGTTPATVWFSVTVIHGKWDVDHTGYTVSIMTN